MGAGLALLRAFFPPDLSWHYLRALGAPVLASLGMAAGGLLLALLASLPLGLASGLRLPGSAAALGVLAALRAIPDLTLAIFCVILVGIGPGAGMLALAIFYGAAMAKVFGELFRTAPPGPLEALRATGASAWQVASFGLLTLKRADLLSYGFYEFESALRASVVIGAVGGGGLGTEIFGSLMALDFRRTTTLILLLLLLIGGLDAISPWLRRHPRLLLALLPGGVLALWAYAPSTASFGHAARTFAGMLPPALPWEDWAGLPRLFGETLFMAFAGTGIALLGALPLGLLAARGLGPAVLAMPLRRGLEALRAIPELVWGLLLIALAGVGPWAGALALGLHSLGALGRLFAETVENLPRPPLAALAATGAPPLAYAGFAVLPLAAGPWAVHALFRLEWNLRMSTVLGLIGAGGIGGALYDAQQLFFYHRMLAYLLLTWALVAASERLGGALRRRFGWSGLPG